MEVMVKLLVENGGLTEFVLGNDFQHKFLFIQKANSSNFNRSITKMLPIITPYPSGKIRSRVWVVDEKKHRENAPAELIYTENEHLLSEGWYLFGNLSCTIGPAFTQFFPDGMIQRQIWCIDGRFNRPGNLPFSIERYSDGQIKSCCWDENHDLIKINYFPNGNVHSKVWKNDHVPSYEEYYLTGEPYIEIFAQRCGDEEDDYSYIEYYPDEQVKEKRWGLPDEKSRYPTKGPAVIKFFESGKPMEYGYLIQGNYHHPEGKATLIEFYESGRIRRERYHQDGVLDRLDQPADIEYVEDGSIKQSTRYIRGEGII